ncbi:MAG: LamG-like jellyroll fold domain-containing protein, partial [Myxococcota bacterium]|nr:LamG-like jellyroll fold domain-containing protein [Myxococcota bacterium]
ASDPDWASGYLSFWGEPFSGSGPRPGSCVQLPAPYGETAALTYHLVVRGPEQSNQIRLFQAMWGGSQYIQLSPWGNNIRFEHSNSSNYDSGVILDDAWHILSYTRSESGEFRFYIDTVLDTTGTHTVSPGATSTWTLGGAYCGDDPFNGDMAYLVVYDAELTEDEITADNEFLRGQMAARGISLP